MAQFGGTGNPIQSNDMSPFATDGLPGWLSQVAEFTQPELPNLEPLSEAEEFTMIQQLLSHEQPCQTMWNAEYLPPHDQQLRQPNHLGAPIPTVNYGAPSSSQQSRPLPQLGMATITAPVPAIVEGTHAESGTVRIVTGAGRGRGRGRARGRGRGNRLPQQQAASGVRRRHTAPSPTSDGWQTVPVSGRRNRAEELLSRMVSQRQYHIVTERQRRNNMNRMFETIRTLIPAYLLPETAARPRSDKVTTVTEMINFILCCQNEHKMLEAQLTQRFLFPRCNVLPPNQDTNMSMGRLTCVDRTGDAAAVTANTTLPPVGSDSCLASFSGTNVEIHVYGQSCCLIISSPHSRSGGLLGCVVATLEVHHLEAICVTVIVRDATQVYTLQCQLDRDVELVQNDLHTTLQSVVNGVVSSSSSKRNHA